MLVVIDIGNTNITMGLFDGDEIIGNYRLTTKLERTSDEYGFMLLSFLNASNIDVKQIQDVIIASVVPKIMYSFTNSIKKYFNKEPIIIGPGIKTGIRIKIDIYGIRIRLPAKFFHQPGLADLTRAFDN